MEMRRSIDSKMEIHHSSSPGPPKTPSKGSPLRQGHPSKHPIHHHHTPAVPPSIQALLHHGHTGHHQGGHGHGDSPLSIYENAHHAMKHRKKPHANNGRVHHGAHVDMSSVKKYVTMEAMKRGMDINLVEEFLNPTRLISEINNIQMSLSGIGFAGDEPLHLSSDSEDDSLSPVSRSKQPATSQHHSHHPTHPTDRPSRRAESKDRDKGSPSAAARRRSSSSSSTAPHQPRLQRGHLYSTPPPRLSVSSDHMAEDGASGELQDAPLLPPPLAMGFTSLSRGSDALALPAFGQRLVPIAITQARPSTKAGSILSTGGAYQHAYARPCSSPAPLVSPPKAAAAAAAAAACKAEGGVAPESPLGAAGNDATSASATSSSPAAPTTSSDPMAVEDDPRLRAFSAHPDILHTKPRAAKSARPAGPPKPKFPSALDADRELISKDDFPHRNVFAHRLRLFARLQEESKAVESWGLDKRLARKAREQAREQASRAASEPIILPSLSPFASFKSNASPLSSFKSSGSDHGPSVSAAAASSLSSTSHASTVQGANGEHLPHMQPFELFSFARKDRDRDREEGSESRGRRSLPGSIHSKETSPNSLPHV